MRRTVSARPRGAPIRRAEERLRSPAPRRHPPAFGDIVRRAGRLATHHDVIIVGAGLSGIGAAAHLQERCPDQQLRDLRGARRDRRHLGSVPLPRHPLRLRHVHARLRVQAVGRREGDRRRLDDPPLHRRDRGRARHRPPHPLRAPRRRRRLVVGRCALDASRSSTTAGASATAAASCCSAAATTATTRPTGRASPAKRGSAAASSIRSSGPPTSTMPASASS